MIRTLVLHTRVDVPDAPNLLHGPNNRTLTVGEVVGLASMYWPTQELVHARQVAFCESGYQTGAWAYQNEDSRGLWQLNVEAHPDFGEYDLFDPQINAYFAHKLWAAQGWHPWTCAHELGII
jgi:Lysozyme like domain